MTTKGKNGPPRITHPRTCNRRIVIAKEDVGPCIEPTIDPRSPMCYFHRLDRTTFPGQARAAELRLAGAATPHRDRAPAVEHDHGTGRVRGGACKNCNHDLLGGAHDSPRMLAAALLYLLAPPTSGRWVRPEEGTDAVLRVVGEVIEAFNAQGRARVLAADAQALLGVPGDGDEPD